MSSLRRFVVNTLDTAEDAYLEPTVMLLAAGLISRMINVIPTSVADAVVVIASVIFSLVASAILLNQTIGPSAIESLGGNLVEELSFRIRQDNESHFRLLAEARWRVEELAKAPIAGRPRRFGPEELEEIFEVWNKSVASQKPIIVPDTSSDSIPYRHSIPSSVFSIPRAEAEAVRQTIFRAIAEVARRAAPAQFLVTGLATLGLVTAGFVVLNADAGQNGDPEAMALIVADQLLKGLVVDVLEFFKLDLIAYQPDFGAIASTTVLLGLRTIPAAVTFTVFGHFFQQGTLRQLIARLATVNERDLLAEMVARNDEPKAT